MLNNNHLIAVQLVAQGKTGKFFSEYINVGQKTISRCRKKREFIASVNLVLNQLRDATQQKMKYILILSLEILEKELNKENSLENSSYIISYIDLIQIKYQVSF